MERNKVYVVSHGISWKMVCGHCTEQRITLTQAAAIKAAKFHVGNLPKGTLAQIVVQNDQGYFRTEWTYGSDPFPPEG